MISAKETSVSRGFELRTLEFTTGSGKVTLPEDSRRASAIIFWKTDSDLSLQMLSEAATIADSFAIDSLGLYLVNYRESLEKIKATVDIDQPNMPYAWNPSGEFLEKYELKSFPYIVVLAAKGKVMDVVEGYQPGRMRGLLLELRQFKNMPGGFFEFKVEKSDDSGH